MSSAWCTNWETRDIPFRRQVALPVCYRDKRIEAGYRIDLIVGGLVVVEIKAIEKTLPVHEAQLATYLKSVRTPIGAVDQFQRRPDQVRHQTAGEHRLTWRLGVSAV